MALDNTVSSVITIVRGLVKDQLLTDGKQLYQYVGDNKFTLPELRVSEDSITVKLNGILLDPENYSYNSDTNQVDIELVASGSSLVTDDLIDITFNYYKKYSDSEIQNYINSSLAYFVQHQYKKTFGINDDDMIVSADDFDPDINDLYFIAIIASILIDPQNISINTPEFKLTANRTKSDQEQIADAFARIKRFVGTLTTKHIHNRSEHWRE